MRSDLSGLAGIPEDEELSLDDHALGVVASLWHDFPLSYDWNPLRIALRDHHHCYRLTRYGGFAVLTCPAPGADGSSSLLWGRGSREDLSAATAGRTMLRADRGTAEHAVSVGVDSGVALFPARNFDEYLYLVTEQHELQGKRFGRRRTYLRSLERGAGEVEFAELDLGSPDDVRAVSAVYADWERGHDQEPTLQDEREALERLLADRPTDERVRAAGLRVDGELAGFAVYDLLAGGVATAHFVKARRSSAEVAGTWQALFTSAYRAGASVMNGGYDGGLAGLRSAKTGLRPSAMRETFFLLPG